jgi:hydrogenase nickel incorporation protein HypA/HybF
MHELSIAQSIISTAEEVARENHAEKIQSLTLEVGALSGVVSDTLRFVFPMACEGTMLAEATLQIEDIPLKVFCRQCDNSSEPATPIIACHKCESSDVEVLSGMELKIKSLEVL